ncbi:hypothetical protein PVA45_07580 (plasmid) [Entomospira entomophila]|uniref:Uncharacterized protein n=1 Tax=Entomospira entomophila TaxID=2719988 RepID=A0A968KS14_9SPIO|nr:hypothetical protein [Entomospira entomophilus]NIZ41279.1 hypothetical protein [Entomospira entomophilus]WDI36193.1 hypothetical protein PVA45_07580 [Entomospira entomophilus]
MKQLAKLFLLILLTLSFLPVSFAQSIKKKSRQRTMEAGTYTSYQLFFAKSSPFLTLSIIKNIGDIPTEYWLEISQISKHKTAKTLTLDNFLALRYIAGEEDKFMKILPEQIIRINTHWAGGNDYYKEVFRVKITSTEVANLLDSNQFSANITLRNGSLYLFRIEEKAWNKMKNSITKLLYTDEEETDQ